MQNREVKKAPPQFPKEQCDGTAIVSEGQSRHYGVSNDRYAPPHRKASLKLQSGTAVSTLRAEPRQDLAAFAAIVRTRRFKRPLCPATQKGIAEITKRYCRFHPSGGASAGLGGFCRHSPNEAFQATAMPRQNKMRPRQTASLPRAHFGGA